MTNDMQEELIPTEDYSKQSQTDIRFIRQLQECGLIEIAIREEVHCISVQQLPLLEKYTRMHYDLDINLEGIEAISHLLQKMEAMQQELNYLHRLLKIYEPLR